MNSAVLPTDGWLPYPVTTRWLPHAFAGPMRSLLAESTGGPPAPTSGADALQTLALVEAAYRSAAQVSVVDVAVPEPVSA